MKITSKPKPWQIRNSNSHSLATHARQLVEDVETLGMANDDKEKIGCLVKGFEKGYIDPVRWSFNGRV